MNPDELRALADALEPMARAPRFEDFDVPAFCAWVRAQADAKPVAWVDVADSYEGPYIFHGKELLPAGRHDLYTLPAPAAPQAGPKREPRPCTCHPDDNPPVPCAQKYALNECRATRSGPDEAQIEKEERP